MTRIGLVTIGQSPRDDVVPEIRGLLPWHVKIVQAGALDGLTPKEIAAYTPKKEANTLVTRLASGQEVKVDKDFVHERLEVVINSLEHEVEMIGLLCSGSFPEISSRVPLLVPHRLLKGFLQALFLPGPLGVLVPSPDQVGPAVEEIRDMGILAIGGAASPYTEGYRAPEVAQSLSDQGAAAILLHCFGYSLSTKNQIRLITGKPVILIRSLFARALAELV